MPNTSEILLEMHNICKTFPGVHALKDVNLQVSKGEVHILLGENGAGKSTLIKILSGVYPPDSGTILFKGQAVTFGNPGDSQHAGISVIYQEPNLIPSMTVAENIHLGNEPRKGSVLPVIDEESLIKGTLDLFDRLNLALDPFSLVSELSLAEQQMVAIARALHLSADLVIMDEPTSMLSQREVAELFSVIRRLRSHGISIIYVTHRLEEAVQIGDTTTILRDGRKITTIPINETTQADLIRMIAGRYVNDKFARASVAFGPEVLRLEQVSSPSGIKDISFSLQAGEILGITGLVGAGGTSILRAIFGADPISTGRLYLDGQPVRFDSPQDAIAHGVGLVSEDRQEQGLVLQMDARQNMTLASLSNIGPGPFIDQQAETNIVNHYARRLAIRPDDLSRKALFLSGGTQQKVVLSKWLATQCRVLLLDEPTRGIDVGARFEFYHLLNELSRRGLGMVVVSSDLAEILSLSDRVGIVRHGQLVAILSRAEANLAEILALASGGTSP
jgi:ribose transport system ATP-binding protein